MSFDGFVGRVRELERIAEVLASARAGQGGMVLVTGESGIGKTSLCRQVAARARAAGFTLAWASCWTEGGAAPLWPWRNIFNGLCGNDADELFAADEGGTSVDPQRFARFEAIAAHLRDACLEQPVLVVIDDIDAADAATLLLTRFIARASPGLRLAVVAASRAPTAGLERDAMTVALHPFDDAETQQFLRAHWRTGFEPDIAVALSRLADGSPLHLRRAVPFGRLDARTHVAACRNAAAALSREFGYARAAELLAEAVEVHERSNLDGPLAPLLVDWGEAILRCGRLAESRPAFTRAAEHAQAEGDPVALARAALGLGGVWVNEHRTRLEWEEAAARQRQALAGLPSTETALRHRLKVRLAAEHVYRGGPVEPLLAAVEETRAGGDRAALAEALSLCHHALLTPKYTKRRLGIAEELIAVASAAGEDLLALMGLCWRTVDLFHLGDRRAVRFLHELRERADLLGCMSIRYIADSVDVMLLIRDGQLDAAEEKAYKCFELGRVVGDADAEGYLGAHLATIRWLQGRGDTEMLASAEYLADSPTLNPAEFAFQATIASTAARLGKHDQARDVLDRLIAPGLATLPESSTWLAGMLAIVEACVVLGDSRLARQCYDLLTPYADLPIAPSLAITCFGTVNRVLGLAASTFGDLDLAIRHLGDAVRANRLLGNRPVTAITMADLAHALANRSGRHDRKRALDLLGRAQAEAERMGMHPWAAEWERRRGELSTLDASLTRSQNHWILSVGEHRAVVADRLGMRYLADLLSRPDQQIKVLDLVGGAEASGMDTHSAQEVLDPAARSAYRRRVKELTEAVEKARSRGDPGAAAQHRAELDALFDQLRQATGKGGRARAFPDAHERARTAVRKAIKRAIDEIARSEPEIGALLAETITTGATCCYSPNPQNPIRWSFGKFSSNL